MKVAILLHGRVRTFFMPLREFPNARVCDKLASDIIYPNNADIFCATDSNDFYLNGKQYYDKSEVTNGNTYRYIEKCEPLDHETASNMLHSELTKFFGARLKGIRIDRPADVDDDPKYKQIKHITGSSCPKIMVKQYQKVKNAYDLMREYEKTNGKYDVVMKCRFDVELIGSQVLHFSESIKENEVYVSGWGGPCVYDWSAYGRRDTMDHFDLYDKLGYTLDDERTYFLYCEKDGGHIEHPVKESQVASCTCNCGTPYSKADISIASEYHIYKICKDNNIEIKYPGSGVRVYTYRDSKLYP